MIPSKKNSILTRIDKVFTVLEAQLTDSDCGIATKKKIFISWSKPLSKVLAHEIKYIINEVFDNKIDIFMSDYSISMGDQWFPKIRDALQSSHLGIIVLTEENDNQPWLMFESGALASTVPIIPIYYGDRKVESPIKAYQSMTDFSKSDLPFFLKSISDHLGFDIGMIHFENYVDKEWPKIKKDFIDIYPYNLFLPGSFLSVDEIKKNAIKFADEEGGRYDLTVGINFSGSIMAPTFIYHIKDRPELGYIHFTKKHNGKLQPRVLIPEYKNKAKPKKILLLDAKYKTGKTIKKAIENLSKNFGKERIYFTIFVSLLYMYKNSDGKIYIYFDGVKLKIDELKQGLHINYAVDKYGKKKYFILYFNKIFYSKQPIDENMIDPVQEELFQYIKSS